MRIKEDFVLRKVADQWVAMPVGRAAQQGSYMITLNKTGAWAWQQLQQPITRQQLVQRLMQTYEVTPETAQRDIDSLLTMLEQLNALE